MSNFFHRINELYTSTSKNNVEQQIEIEQYKNEKNKKLLLVTPFKFEESANSQYEKLHKEYINKCAYKNHKCVIAYDLSHINTFDKNFVDSSIKFHVEFDETYRGTVEKVLMYCPNPILCNCGNLILGMQELSVPVVLSSEIDEIVNLLGKSTETLQ